jgi:hypothetical protein
VLTYFSLCCLAYFFEEKQFAPVNRGQSFSIRQSIASTITVAIAPIFTCHVFYDHPLKGAGGKISPAKLYHNALPLPVAHQPLFKLQFFALIGSGNIQDIFADTV